MTGTAIFRIEPVIATIRIAAVYLDRLSRRAARERPSMTTPSLVPLAGSQRSHAASAAAAGAVDPAERIELTVITRRAASLPRDSDGVPVRLSPCRALRQRYGSAPPTTQLVADVLTSLDPAHPGHQQRSRSRRMRRRPSGRACPRVRYRAQPASPAARHRRAGHAPVPHRQPADPGRARRRSSLRCSASTTGRRPARISGSRQPAAVAVSYTPPQVAEMYQFPAGTDGIRPDGRDHRAWRRLLHRPTWTPTSADSGSRRRR